MNDHQEIYAAEATRIPVDRAFENWIDAVEDLIDRDPAGDLHTDGYSLPTFRDMFNAGVTAERASTLIVGSVWVDADGNTLRLATAEHSLVRESYVESFFVGRPNGSIGNVTYHLDDGLPDLGTPAWSPLRDVTEVQRLQARIDSLLAGARCPQCSATEWNGASIAREQRDEARAEVQVLKDRLADLSA